MATMNRNIPLSIDDELLAQIDAVAETTKESRSAVMRRAIREGLPVVSAGGNADAIILDGELSKDVNQVSIEGKLSRAKVILEAIKIGLEPFYNRLMREQVVERQDQTPEEASIIIAHMEQNERMNNPMGRELRMALRQRGAAITRFWDLLMHVPEAWRRCQLVEKLTSIRKDSRGIGYRVWGCGLSTEEIEWQIKMAEKYGVGGKTPDYEIKARELEREKEDRTHCNMVSGQIQQPFPEV